MGKPTKVPGLEADTPLSTAAPLLLRARTADLRRLEAAVGAGGEPEVEAVHDMRVAARRLRVALDALACEDAARLEPQVKALQDALGALRDVQVHRDWMLAQRADRDRAVAEQARQLAHRIDDRRGGAEKHLRRALRAGADAVAPALERLALDGSARGRLGGATTRSQVRTALKGLGRRLDAVDARVAPRPAHRLRIAAKKLRYLVELVAPGHGGRAKRLLREVESLLDLLGTLHDTDVRVALLSELAGQGLPPGERTAANALLAAVRGERGRQARELDRELSRWRGEVLRAARRAFGRARAGGMLRGLDRERQGPGARAPKAAPAAAAQAG